MASFRRPHEVYLAAEVNRQRIKEIDWPGFCLWRSRRSAEKILRGTARRHTAERVLASIMRNKKQMTAKALAANGNNSKSSTGPRTRRGKDFAKFNAVKYGLSAEEVVIPLCDGDGGVREFQSLVDDLCEEFHPVGTLESWLLSKIAESMWRLRRGPRAEHGCARMAALWNRCLLPSADSYSQHLGRSLAFAEQCVKILNAAREEIWRTGTLSPKTYASVVPLVEDQRQTQVNTVETEKTPNPVIGDEFAQLLEGKKSAFEADAHKIQTQLGRMIPDRLAAFAIPPAEETDKILRYESRIQKQLDWAMDRLLECQERRKKAQSYFQGEAQGDLHLAGGK